MLPSIGRGEAFQPQKLLLEKDKSAEIQAGLLAGSGLPHRAIGLLCQGSWTDRGGQGFQNMHQLLELLKKCFLLWGWEHDSQNNDPTNPKTSKSQLKSSLVWWLDYHQFLSVIKLGKKGWEPELVVKFVQHTLLQTILKEKWFPKQERPCWHTLPLPEPREHKP